MNGILIREAQPEDAKDIIQYIERLSAEPNIYIAMSPGEFGKTEQQEAEILRSFHEEQNAIYLIAKKETRLVGMIVCAGGHRKTTSHVVSISMSVDQEFRRQGIGKLLMEQAVQWAKNNPVVSRMKLLVFAKNEPAIRLYEKFGFVVEGRHKNAIFRDGVYLDNLSMALLV